jgi:hypothetical protein
MDDKCAGSKGRPGPALRSENWRGSGTASQEYAAKGIPVPLPEIPGIKVDFNKTEENFQQSCIKPMYAGYPEALGQSCVNSGNL